MFYLFLAIVTSAMISIIMRLSSEKITYNISMLAASYLTSTVIAACYMDLGSVWTVSSGMGAVTAMAVVNGCFYVGGLVLMQRNIPRSGVVLTSTYSRLGLIVCMVLSVILFREIPTVLQLIGFFLAVGAILLNGGTHTSDQSRFRPELLLVLLVSGIGDTWVKLFGVLGKSDFSDQFLMITFIAAAILCLGVMLYRRQKMGLWEVVFGAAIAVPNYYNSRFLLKSLQTLPGIIVYPTFSVATLLLITVLGICLFKERLSRRQAAAMGMILAALALLNL